MYLNNHDSSEALTTRRLIPSGANSQAADKMYVSDLAHLSFSDIGQKDEWIYEFYSC